METPTLQPTTSVAGTTWKIEPGHSTTSTIGRMARRTG